jgi:hypothetical protein
MEHQQNEGTAIRLQLMSSARKRIARAAKRFMPFGFGRGEDDDADQISDRTVRRFERLAGVADEFFRYVRFGGRPRSLMVCTFKVPMEPLLAGNTLEFSFRNGSKEALLLLHPCDVDRKEILLFLSYEDTSTWEKNLLHSVMFRLHEGTDILDIVMSSLEFLPPQFGVACATTREFARELLTQETSYSINPSSLSVWCIHASRRCNHNSTDNASAVTSGKQQLQFPIIRVDTIYFTLPPNGASQTPADDDMPLRLVCHVAPHLVPKSYSDHYDQIELEGAHARKGSSWCPRSSTYMLVQQELSVPPPTLQQLYRLENSD